MKIKEKKKTVKSKTIHLYINIKLLKLYNKQKLQSQRKIK